MTDIATIVAMHEFKRPMGSESEAEFVQRFITPLGAERDPFGNYLLAIGPDPTVLWSSHTDSVHGHHGKQRLAYKDGLLSLHAKSRSSCLGADDAAGVWIMTEMIKAGVPGLYVFHYGEEKGGIGSGDIADRAPHLLMGIQAAVAFDRRGTTSIITHQMSRRTCSDAFGRSLMEQLPKHSLDQWGSYTDTETYRALVPECTNISVGYQGAHTSREVLNVPYLIALRDQMVRIDASRFVIARDPSVIDMLPTYPSYRGYSASQPAGLTDDDTLYGLCQNYPYSVSMALEEAGVSYEGLLGAVNKSRGQRNLPPIVPTVRTVKPIKSTKPAKPQALATRP